MEAKLSKLIRQVRLQKKISLESASDRLKIDKKYLKMIEGSLSSELESIPKVYLKGYLRNYMNFLGIDINQVHNSLDEMKQDHDFNKKSSKHRLNDFAISNLFMKFFYHHINRRSPSWLIIILSWLLIVIVISFY